MNNKYVILKVNGVTPSHNMVESFNSPYGIRVIDDPDTELSNQLNSIIYRMKKE